MRIRNWMAILLVFLIGIAVAGCAKKSAPATSQPTSAAKTLYVYSGAAMQKPMDEIGAAFEKQTGIKVEYNYGNCAQLMGQMEVTKQGDVFMGGALSDMQTAQAKGMVDNFQKVCYQIPVIAVPAGNPAKITCLPDLAKPGVKVILGDEKTSAIGMLAVQIFQKNNLWPAVKKNIVAEDPTVNEVVIHTAMKQADASIVTEGSASAKNIAIITIPESQNVIDTAPIGILNFSKQQDLANQFVDFVMSPQGKTIFQKDGFTPVS
jgi:molybdate transport system substrate-binding protein